jgi:hypothetical protein
MDTRTDEEPAPVLKSHWADFRVASSQMSCPANKNYAAGLLRRLPKPIPTFTCGSVPYW